MGHIPCLNWVMKYGTIWFRDNSTASSTSEWVEQVQYHLQCSPIMTLKVGSLENKCYSKNPVIKEDFITQTDREMGAIL